MTTLRRRVEDLERQSLAETKKFRSFIRIVHPGHVDAPIVRIWCNDPPFTLSRNDGESPEDFQARAWDVAGPTASRLLASAHPEDAPGVLQ